MVSKEPKDKSCITRRGFLKATGAAGMETVVMSAGLAAPAVLAADNKEGEKTAARPMPKRRLGKTGVEVSVLALGGMFDTLNNQLLLKQAFNWGISYWDTAEGYGGGMSEDGIGRWFSRNPSTRKDIFLVTKSHPEKVSDLSERLDKSLQRLKTDYVDCYFLHGLTGADPDQLGDEVSHWVEATKKAGKIRFFGFSTHSNMEDCLLGASKLAWVDVVMLAYNFRLMQTDRMKEALSACIKADIGLVAMKTQGGGPVKTDSEAELKIAGRFLNRGFTDKQAKLKAVWENPSIASICSQMPNLTVLAANVAAARDQSRLSRTDFELFDEYARQTRHGYCAGCTDICSSAVDGLVPISEVMRYLMYYRDYGERDLARASYAALPDEVKARLARIDFAKAEKSCPQGLAIAELMRSAAGLLA